MGATGSQADLTSDQPYYIFPLMPSIQVLNVVDPKYGVPPPPITSHNLQENTFLLGRALNTAGSDCAYHCRYVLVSL